MTHQDKHNNRRDELLIELGKEEGALRARIAENESAIYKHKNEANKHSEWQRHAEAQQEMAHASRLSEEIRSADKRLRDIELDRNQILTGNHPELRGLNVAAAGKTIEANQAEKTAAQNALVAMLTPELRAAAQRYVVAFKNCAPLDPEPTLASLLAAHGAV